MVRIEFQRSGINLFLTDLSRLRVSEMLDDRIEETAITAGFQVALRRLCKHSYCAFPVRSDDASELVILRDNQKRPIPYEDTNDIRQMRSDVEWINAALASHWIDLHLSDKRMAELNARMASDHRIGNRETFCFCSGSIGIDGCWVFRLLSYGPVALLLKIV